MRPDWLILKYFPPALRYSSKPLLNQPSMSEAPNQPQDNSNPPMPKRVKSLSRQASGQGIAETHVAAGVRQALDAIESRERDIEEEMERLLILEAPPSISRTNILFNELEGQPEKMKGLTNFFPCEILRFHAGCEEYFPKRSRGRKPSIFTLDDLVLYLYKLKSNQPHLNICACFKVSKQSLTTAFNTVGPALYEGLKNFHTANLPRPKRLGGFLQDLALAVDTTYFPIPLTHGEVGSSHDTWSEHYHVNCYKKQVAVEASAPHRAIFISPSVNGNVADRTILRQYYEQLVEYLKKTDQEKEYFPPGTPGTWSIVGDSAYIGNNAETPGVRCLAIPRTNMANSAIELQELNEAKLKRVVVERFFGRLKGLWGICRDRYKYAYESFNMNIDTCILLTNQHIELMNLDQHDQDCNSYYTVL